MVNKFETSVAFVLKHEGGYSFDPKDLGGETNYGISKRSHPTVDIKNLTIQGALDIYKREYWDANNVESLDLPLGITALDSYVQHGAKLTNKFLDLAKGDYREIINQRRILYLGIIQRNPSEGRFKNGWLNRLNDLSKYCQITIQNQ